jgi:hypothetical protein
MISEAAEGAEKHYGAPCGVESGIRAKRPNALLHRALRILGDMALLR